MFLLRGILCWFSRRFLNYFIMSNLLFDTNKYLKTIVSDQLETIEKEIFLNVKALTSEYKVVFIPGNVPSLKNNKEIVQMYTKLSICCQKPVRGKKPLICTQCNKPTKRLTRPSLIASKRVMKYKKDTEQYYIDARPLFMKVKKENECPFQLGIYIVRDSKRKYDFNNATHIIHDIIANDMIRKMANGSYIKTMSKWIEDDDVSNLRPVCVGTHVDKNEPGCYIMILKSDIYLNTLHYNLKILRNNNGR